MNKAYNRVNDGKGWKDYPSVESPVNAYNLNKADVAIDEIDNRVIVLDSTKAAKIEVSELFKDVSLDERTGILTFTRKNGATVVIDTPIEKIQTGIYYDPVVEKLILPLIDGTTIEADLSRLMKYDEFLDSDTIAFSVKPDGKITAIVKEGSIEEKHLRPDYLADIRMAQANAQLNAENSEKYAKLSESYTHGKTGIRDGEDTDNAKEYARQAKESAQRAEEIVFGDVLSVPTAPATSSEDNLPAATAFDLFLADGLTRLKDLRTFLGSAIIDNAWYGIISVRHRNGYGDGAGYGMYLRSLLDKNGDLKWGKQIKENEWQAERTLLDSENYSQHALPLTGGKITGAIRFKDDGSIAFVTPDKSGGHARGVHFINKDETKTWGGIGAYGYAGELQLLYLSAGTDLPWMPGNGLAITKDLIRWKGKELLTVDGNAATATKAAQDSNGNVIKDTYAKKSIYGDTAVSLGRKSGTTVGTNSFAFGYNTTASGTYDHAEGNATTAKGGYSHAEGNATTASGAVSHAEGSATTASGYASHAGGNSSIASGNSSHALGIYSHASNISSCAIGKGNKIMAEGGGVNNDIGDAFVVGNGHNATSERSNAFRVTYQGDIYGTKAFQSSGADYAEYIKPWSDGNPEDEDRVGYFVTIKDGFLKKAEEGDYIAGITSGNPSVVGNADEDYYWRYERDEFNRIVLEDVPETVQAKDDDGNPLFDEETHEPVMVETGNMVPNARMKLAEGYDPSLQESYIERKYRKEWEYVGMLGVLPVRDDGTCVPGKFCKCGSDGIATLAENRGFDTFFVIERKDKNLIMVELR